MEKNKAIFIQIPLILLFILSVILVVHSTIPTLTAANDTPSSTDQSLYFPIIWSNTTITSTNCRYGVSSLGNDEVNLIQDLGVGWVLDFTVDFNHNVPDGVEYTPMIRFKPDLDAEGNRTGNYRVSGKPFTDEPSGLGPVVVANPGKLWLIGNEVDRKELQDDLMPDVYATAYHDAYHFIKERDPSAQVAISGLVEVTPGRLQYLDLIWESYQEKYDATMPVDVWNMHIYILPEIRQNGQDAGAAVALGTDPALAIFESGNNVALCSAPNVYCHAEHDSMAIFKEQVVAMRQWMKQHGQQNKPLILSEYSLLHPYNQEGDLDPNTCYLQDEYGDCFTPERVSEFMSNTFNYLETAANPSLGFHADNYRLVQQWLWFTPYFYGTFASNLVESGYTETSYTFRLPGHTFNNHINTLRPFSPDPFISEVSYPIAKTITPTGTTSVTISATVFNNGNTESTMDYTVNFYADAAKTKLIGSATIPIGLAGCARRSDRAEVVWADLSAGVHPYWAEVEGGNMISGFVIVNPEQIYLPVISR